MKTITQTKQVEETLYCCDKCDFKSKDNYDTENHYVKAHSFLKEKTINIHRFLYFQTKEDAKLFIKHCGGFDGRVYWDSPGWYEFNRTYAAGGMICAGYISPIIETEARIQNEIAKLEDQLNEIEGLKNERT